MAAHKKRELPDAKDVATNYSFYVNPNAKERDDPEKLQATAQPILEEWHSKRQLKENVLRAVILYSQGPEALQNSSKKDQNDLLDAITKRIERLLSNIQVSGAISPSLQQDFEEISDELEEFGSQYLSFGD